MKPLWNGFTDKTGVTDNRNIEGIHELPPPENLIHFFPISHTPIESTVAQARDTIGKIMKRRDDRLLIVAGPCSVHNPASAREYARKLMKLREKYRDTIEIIMRVYFEKPRTTVGWKGLINDPYLNGSYKIEEGLRIARELLMYINSIGMPAGTEFLDVISPQYIGDLIAWGAIGARTTESQVHRELASGLSAPIGFKNGTDGNTKIATDAIQASSRSHHFLSINKHGKVSTVQTKGNEHCHIILRGGMHPNYDETSVALACEALRGDKLPAIIMIDCSHGNSGKDYRNQPKVASDIARQIAGGENRIFGLMLESHLVEGSQKFTPGKDNPDSLNPNQSITDGCISIETTEQVIASLSDAVIERRKTTMK